jgi:aspartate racemase
LSRGARHVGIVAVSAEGAALCYRTICSEGAEILGRHRHPEISTHTYPLADYMRELEAGRWDEAARMLLASARKLVDAGAEILVCPDNTIHQALDLMLERSPAPWLHIASEVAAVAAARGFRRLGVLGTRFLMEGPVYRSKLEPAGIASEIPGASERAEIDAIIFDELVYGRFEDRSRRFFAGVVDALAARGCDAVVLGCTEIPLLVSQADCSLPVLDSTRILARAALREAVRDR